MCYVRELLLIELLPFLLRILEQCTGIPKFYRRSINSLVLDFQIYMQCNPVLTNDSNELNQTKKFRN